MSLLQFLEVNRNAQDSKESKDINTQIQLRSILEPYKGCESIPMRIVNQVLHSAFPTCEILHEYSGFHKIVKVKISNLLAADITNWSYNRPPDIVRCNDIARYIYRSRNVVDTMLYLSYNNLTQSFDIIDGIHRYTSLKIIQNQNTIVSLPEEQACCEFGTNGDALWLYDAYILLNIRLNASEGEIIEIFKTLNKSNPIPELYIRDVKKDKKEIIESVANNWQMKYRTHFSANNKPNKPNANRDRFIEFLELIYDKYKIKNESRSRLDDILTELNTTISFNLPKKISRCIKQKCYKSGLWMFIYSFEELGKMV